MNQAISTSGAPGAIGPYSQGVRAGNTIYVSGQLPADPATGALVEGDIQAKTRRALENVRAILQEAGAGMGDVVKVTVYLKDMASFAAMNEAYAEYFSEPYPARAAFAVAELPKDAGLEIECVAVTAG